ncbi:MAG: hypothetical protein DMG00_26440, partial [Acidobacteria bacterium]
MTRTAFGALVGLTAMILVAQVLVIQGQTATGRILGTVRDSTGAVLPGATVSATSLETRAVRTVVTDVAGTYQILSIAAGDYAVEATLSGFQTATRSPVTVTVGAAAVANFDLS